jgi:DNA-binding CsgD family transcriptional regulator/energy-coupling factor transporter ATP-binding protein EcfA2
MTFPQNHTPLPALPVPPVGREHEQRALADCLSDALAGHGRLVLISGEAGIGKTTLVSWLAQEATRQSGRVLTGYCYDLTLTPPYGPWSTALAALDAAAQRNPLHASHSATSQAVLFDRLHAWLATLAAAQPLVLILEDLHWSDPATIELLRYLGRSLRGIAVLLVATYRADELTPRQPLYALLPYLVREAGAERIDLSALTPADTQRLVAREYRLSPQDETRLVGYLHARSGGNPFYLSELLRTLERDRLLLRADGGWLVGDLSAAPVPALVRQVIEGRLAALDAHDRALLELAAVIGQEIPLDIWQAASGDDARLYQVLEQARDARILSAAPTGLDVAFTHALLRETLYHALSLPRRQQLHRQVAEVLAVRPHPPSGEVAAHFTHALDARGIDWLVQAGEQALALYAARDAVEDFTRAQDLAARTGSAVPLAALRGRALAYAMLDEFDRARRDHEALLNRARVSDDQRTEWQSLVDLALLWSGRDYDRTGAYCRAALDLAQRIGDQQLVARSLNQLGNWHVNRDEPGTAIPLHEQALAICEATGDRVGLADTLDLLGIAHYMHCDLPASTTYFGRAVPLLRELDDRQRLATTLSVMALNGGELDGVIAAPVFRAGRFWVECVESGLALAREIGWPTGEAFGLFVLSTVTGVRGDLPRAMDAAVEGCALAERIGHPEWIVGNATMLSVMYRELFALTDAAAFGERALAAASGLGARFWVMTTTSTLASAYIEAGDLARATALLDAFMPALKSHLAWGEAQYWYTRALLALARDEPDETLRILAVLVPDDRTLDPARVAIPPALLRAAALQRLGRSTEALPVLRAARDSAALFGFPLHHWRANLALGQLHRSLGQEVEARRAIDAARSSVDSIGASLTDTALRDRFVTATLALFAADHAGPAPSSVNVGLSPRELDVLRLLVEGKSDREIAAALFISPRTVMRHVSSILTKLDVPSRTAAAALALRQRLV